MHNQNAITMVRWLQSPKPHCLRWTMAVNSSENCSISTSADPLCQALKPLGSSSSEKILLALASGGFGALDFDGRVCGSKQMAHLPLNQLAARLSALLSARLPLAQIGCSDTKAAWRPNETQIKWERTMNAGIPRRE